MSAARGSTAIPTIARWAIALVAALAVVTFGGHAAVNARVAASVKRDAADLGVDLEARHARYAFINPTNEDGYRGADVELLDVTMRFPDRTAVLRAPSVSIYLRAESVMVEIDQPSIELAGDLTQLVDGARDFENRADAARRPIGRPVEIAVHDASLVARGIVGPGTEARLRLRHFFGHLGGAPTRGFREHDEGGETRSSIGQAELTWFAEGRHEGPIPLDLERVSRGTGENPETALRLELGCETRHTVRWADGVDAASFAEPVRAHDQSRACPMTLRILRSLGVGEATSASSVEARTP